MTLHMLMNLDFAASGAAAPIGGFGGMLLLGAGSVAWWLMVLGPPIWF